MSQNKNWFVHLGEEIFGPVPTEVINVMLRQSRLQFTDFIWSTGLTKWVRIIDVDDFAGILPAYPRTPIPLAKNTQPQIVEEEVFEEEAEEQEEVEEPKIVVKKAPVKTHTEKPKLPKVPSEDVRTGNLSGNPPKPGAKLSVFPRMKLKGKINIEGTGSFKIVDLSEGGLFVAAKESIDIGTEVVFTIEADVFKELLPMTGVVIRHGDRYDERGFAVEFMRVNPIYKRLIQNAIKDADKS